MRQVNFRLSDAEFEHLQRFCELTERQQSDVLRQAVRKLAISGALNPIDSLGESMYPDAVLEEYSAGLIAPQTPHQLKSHPKLIPIT